MNMERDCVMEKGEGAHQETKGQQQLNVEWTESEWFRIYLQLARENQDDSE
jgi:hypothetical protein